MTNIHEHGQYRVSSTHYILYTKNIVDMLLKQEHFGTLTF